MAQTVARTEVADEWEDTRVKEASPFRPARITEGYPFDEIDKKVIRRMIDAVARRQRAATDERAAAVGRHSG